MFQSYYKLPAPQTPQENCVAHNGSLIPIPGRDIMVQAWYQGGISVFDWTDAKHPTEIAFFDRGPIDSTRMVMGGSLVGVLVQRLHHQLRDRARARHFRAEAERAALENEIDAAKTVHFDEFNTQGQPALVWPTTFALARAYVDQLERSKGLSTGQVIDVRNDLASAERAGGSGRHDTLTHLAVQLDTDAQGSSDAAKVRMLAGTVRTLATTATAAAN